MVAAGRGWECGPRPTPPPPSQGAVLLRGRPPSAWTEPAWRARVLYVPSARPRLAGSPADLLRAVEGFAAQTARRARSRSRSPPPPPPPSLTALARSLDMDAGLLTAPWDTLSTGQAARAALAVALATAPDVLLVDEPTAALDGAAACAVERALVASGAAIVWVTHDGAQPRRVGGRAFAVEPGAGDAPARWTGGKWVGPARR